MDGALVFRWWWAGGGVGAGQEGPREVADAGYHGGEVEVSLPEAVVGGLVAEDEHEAYDYGERGDGCGWQAHVSVAEEVGVAYSCCEGEVEDYGEGDVGVDGSWGRKSVYSCLTLAFMFAGNAYTFNESQYKWPSSWLLSR